MKIFNPHESTRLEQLRGMPLASFKKRTIAFLIDFFSAFAIFMLILILGTRLLDYLGIYRLDKSVNLKFNLQNWYGIIMVVIYFGLFTYFTNGYTPGKRLMKIRVVSLVHERISLWHSFERALGYAASALEFGFGFIQYFIHPNARTVHDRIAETIVVRVEKRKKG